MNRRKRGVQKKQLPSVVSFFIVARIEISYMHSQDQVESSACNYMETVCWSKWSSGWSCCENDSHCKCRGSHQCSCRNRHLQNKWTTGSPPACVQISRNCVKPILGRRSCPSSICFFACAIGNFFLWFVKTAQVGSWYRILNNGIASCTKDLSGSCFMRGEIWRWTV